MEDRKFYLDLFESIFGVLATGFALFNVTLWFINFGDADKHWKVAVILFLVAIELKT